MHKGLQQPRTFHLLDADLPLSCAFRAQPLRASGELTWYMMEEGGGSMHGCWSGRGSSSSRSTLDRASSRVTWVVMAAVCVLCTEGKEEKTGWRMSGVSEMLGARAVSPCSGSFRRTKGGCSHALGPRPLTTSSRGTCNLCRIFEDLCTVYKVLFYVCCLD